MVNFHTNLIVADNSGAKEAKCIKILKSRKTAQIGDIIIVSIQKYKSIQKIKRVKNLLKSGKVQKGLIIRTKKKLKRKDGSQISFNQNALILLGNKDQPMSNRIFGPVTNELRIKKYMKVISLATHVI